MSMLTPEYPYLQPLGEIPQDELEDLASNLIELANDAKTRKELELRNLPSVIDHFSTPEMVLNRLKDEQHMAAVGQAGRYAIRLDNGELTGMAEIKPQPYLRVPQKNFLDEVLFPILGWTNLMKTEIHRQDNPRITAWTAGNDKNYEVLANAYKSLCMATGDTGWTTEPVRSKRASEAIADAMISFGEPNYYDLYVGEGGLKSQLYKASPIVEIIS